MADSAPQGAYQAPHDIYTAMKLGELDGKLSSVTERQSRHETWVGNKLDSMDSKLDSIAIAIAGREGRSAFLASLKSPAMWALTTLISAAVWLFGHYAIRPIIN